MQSTLQSIINNEELTAFFQPICASDGNQIYGYEALIRGPSDSPFHSPSNLFDAAVQYDLLSELELICRKISIKRFVELGLQGRLFLNISPMVFLQADHPQGKTLSYLKEHGLHADQVVIEISEKYPIEQTDVLQGALIHYRNLGFKVAVDDLGAGYAGLKLWSEVKPDYVKIDRYFINQCHLDPVKREFIKSILNIGQCINAKVIAEGIETLVEFEQLEDLGINIYQGYLFGRPEPFPSRKIPTVILNRQRVQNFPVHFDHKVSSLLQVSYFVNFDENVKNIVDYLYSHPSVHTVPVLRDERPIGMIMRGDVLELFSTAYGRALNERKTAIEIMMNSPVIVEANTRLDEVAQAITLEHDDKILWHFIITDKNHYVGTGSIRDLLRQLTQQQLQHARYANPLSMLPGNVPIYRYVDNLIKHNKAFRMAYFDLNNFKPYNDFYGYAKGDKVIQLVASIMQSCCDTKDFIGHIGGDDFVAIFEGQSCIDCCEKITQEFDHKVREYYNDDDLDAGGIETKSRYGQLQFYPLLSLAVGVVEPNVSRCHSHHDVAELASEAKKQAKQISGSHVFISRRGGPTELESQPKKAMAFG